MAELAIITATDCELLSQGLSGLKHGMIVTIRRKGNFFTVVQKGFKYFRMLNSQIADVVQTELNIPASRPLFLNH